MVERESIRGGIVLLTLNDLLKAQENLQGITHITNLDYSTTFSRIAGADVYLKTENLQKTGSFKIRGAYNKIAQLSEEEKARGVIAASAGNHAQGVAFASRRAGIQSSIVMPEGTPLSKVAATKGYGAHVVLHGQVYDDAYQKAREIQENTGATFIHAFDDLQVIAGQGTIGLEILAELPETEIMFVPIGGGGLASGVAAAAKLTNPSVKIIGVEAEGAACFKASREQGKKCNLTSAHTIADGIAVKCPGELTYQLLEQYLDDVVTVTDEEIASTILLLLERAKLMVEGAGAAALAAILYHKYPVVDKKTVAVISGGNIDVNMISLIIEKGLVKTGRRIGISTTMMDKPGNLQDFLQSIAKERGNIISIEHDRAQAYLPVDKARVKTVLEIQGKEHLEKIINSLESKGFKVEFL